MKKLWLMNWLSVVAFGGSDSVYANFQLVDFDMCIITTVGLNKAHAFLTSSLLILFLTIQRDIHELILDHFMHYKCPYLRP